jgi:hypothetical protein
MTLVLEDLVPLQAKEIITPVKILSPVGIFICDALVVPPLGHCGYSPKQNCQKDVTLGWNVVSVSVLDDDNEKYLFIYTFVRI